MKRSSMVGVWLAMTLGASLHGVLPPPRRSPPTSKAVRTPADILRRREKRAAKLARRAERARKGGKA